MKFPDLSQTVSSIRGASGTLLSSAFALAKSLLLLPVVVLVKALSWLKSRISLAVTKLQTWATSRLKKD